MNNDYKINLLTNSIVTQDLINDIKNLLVQLGVKYMPALSLEKITELIDTKGNYIFVTQNTESKVIGLLVVSSLHAVSGTKTWIEDVIVDTNSRGLGIGTKLVEKALEVSKENNITHINLTCKPEREHANKIYQKLGFNLNPTNYYRYNIKN